MVNCISALTSNPITDRSLKTQITEKQERNLFPSSFSLLKLQPKSQGPHQKIPENILLVRSMEAKAPSTLDHQHLPVRSKAPANWLLQTQGPRKCSHLFNRACRWCQRKGPGLWVLIPALLLAGGVTSSELFTPTGAKVSHLDDDQVGTKKGPRDLDIEMKLTRLNYRIFF